MTNTRPGNSIDNNCAVFITFRKDERGVFCLPNLSVDDFGDRAVVVEADLCEEHDNCTKLFVAPDDSDDMEYVHADNVTEYTVETDDCSGTGKNAYSMDNDPEQTRELMADIFATIPTGPHTVTCPWCDNHTAQADANGILLPHRTPANA
jgi:hypothetical protein